jgi:hypothetical protein
MAAFTSASATLCMQLFLLLLRAIVRRLLQVRAVFAQHNLLDVCDTWSCLSVWDMITCSYLLHYACTCFPATAAAAAGACCVCVAQPPA